MSSRLIVNSIRHTGASSDAITLDSAGKCSFPNGGAGKILQVVSVNKTDVQSTTSTSYVDITGLSLNITPTSSSSKILLTGMVVIHHSLYTAFVRILRDSTEIGTSATGSNSAYIVYNLNEDANQSRAINFEDSPNTTSQVTYKLQCRRDGGSTLYINAHSAGTTNDYISTSVLTAMEVAG
tara:strand:+ start:270 stop:812 length:543 start_codon:yes stop_codon:yes gene_type:complete